LGTGRAQAALGRSRRLPPEGNRAGADDQGNGLTIIPAPLGLCQRGRARTGIALGLKTPLFFCRILPPGPRINGLKEILHEKKYLKPIQAGAVVAGCFALCYKMLTDPASPYWGIGLALCLAVTGAYLTGAFRFLKQWWKYTLIPRGLRKGKG